MTEVTINFSGQDELDNRIKMLVAGTSGSGKTRFALTAPNPIFANCLSGVATLAMHPGTPFVNVAGETDLLALKVALDRSPEEREELFGFPVETLVVDTVDEFQRRLLQERLVSQKRELPIFEDWNWLGVRCNSIFGGLAGLDINVIFLLHIKQDMPEDKLFIKPALQGAFTDQICQYVEYAVLLKNQSEREEPVDISFNGSEIDYDLEFRSFNYMITKPTSECEWLHDYTNTLPPFFDIDFRHDFENIVRARGTLGEIPSSTSKTVEVEAVPQRERNVKSLDGLPSKVISKELEDAVVSSTDVKCSSCDKMVENRDWVDISTIKFGKAFCKTCYTQQKDK